jgi:hypothetical protein
MFGRGFRRPALFAGLAIDRDLQAVAGLMIADC